MRLSPTFFQLDFCKSERKYSAVIRTRVDDSSFRVAMDFPANGSVNRKQNKNNLDKFLTLICEFGKLKSQLYRLLNSELSWKMLHELEFVADLNHSKDSASKIL